MNKTYLCNAISAGQSTRQIAGVCHVSQTTVRYWLARHGLTTRGHVINIRHARRFTHCRVCAKPTTRGGMCQSCYNKVRRFRAKTAAVRLKGSKCARCGWTGPIPAFEFHHARGQKEFNIGNVANKSWIGIKREIYKCELLCANCHRIAHSRQTGAAFLSAVANYRGKLLEA